LPPAQIRTGGIRARRRQDRPDHHGGRALSEFNAPTAAAGPHGIAAGPDGALWFTEANGNKIGRVTTAGAFSEFVIPTGFSQPTGITAGPDGALWFTEFNGSKTGRITTAGVLDEFVVLTPSSFPFGVTVGPDGALWFTETGVNKIGRITTGLAPIVAGIPVLALPGALLLVSYGSRRSGPCGLDPTAGLIPSPGVVSSFPQRTEAALESPSRLAVPEDPGILYRLRP